MDQGEYAHQEQKRNNLLTAKIEQKRIRGRGVEEKAK